MKKARKNVRITMEVTAPAGMTAAQVRREVRTRINKVAPWYDAYTLNLPHTTEGSDGYLRVRVTRMGAAR
ncbi:MAG: hypothetical protein O9972_39755 [Burkholderiales bacterium]|nr:hypothetical protein [Burkholderiales bacterium]